LPFPVLHKQFDCLNFIDFVFEFPVVTTSIKAK